MRPCSLRGMRIALALVLLALTAACATAPAGPATARTAPSAATSVDLLACQHFASQGAYMAKLATPTLLDIAQFTGWVKLDASESDGALSSDFASLYAALNAVISRPGDSDTSAITTADGRVKRACDALGLTFSPAA